MELPNISEGNGDLMITTSQNCIRAIRKSQHRGYMKLIAEGAGKHTVRAYISTQHKVIKFQIAYIRAVREKLTSLKKQECICGQN